MSGIEDKIRKNIHLLNAEEPLTGHRERFSDRLDQFHAEQHERWYERYDLSLRIAAAVIIFAVIGTLLYSGAFSRLKSIVSEQIVAAEIPTEVREVMQYYNVITEQKVEEIDKLAVSEDEAQRVKAMAMKELKELEQDRIALEKEYAKQPGNERIMNAMLNNQQRKSEILDKILNTLNQVN